MKNLDSCAHHGWFILEPISSMFRAVPPGLKAHFIKAWNAGLKARSSTNCAKAHL